MTLKELLQQDNFIRHNGLELLAVSPGYAQGRLVVARCHINAAGVCHGGALFTLADLVCAAAVNSHLQVALSVSVTMSYHRPAALGDILTAQAREIYDGSKLPACQGSIVDQDGQPVASFTALFYKKEQPVQADTIE